MVMEKSEESLYGEENTVVNLCNESEERTQVNSLPWPYVSYHFGLDQNATQAELNLRWWCGSDLDSD